MKPHYFPARSLPLAGFALLLAFTQTSADPAKSEPAIDFNPHIRPILSDNCFACHGPDDKARKAKLRLDTKLGAFAPLRRGGRALVPGKPAESELIARITSDDPGELMPPPKSGKHLKPAQLALLKRW